MAKQMSVFQKARLMGRYREYVICSQSKGKKAKPFDQWVAAGMPRCEK